MRALRTAFIETLCGLAQEDERIWLLTGDLGFSVLERFADCFPGRFVNAGVAEQNMAGVAAGLALSGKVVFTYSIANFPTMRCLEQIRNDICYHHLNVKIVAVGGGLTYGSLGYTHFAVEDLAIMRALPHITVMAPGDPLEASLAIKVAVSRPGPYYIRLGKAGEPGVHKSPSELDVTRPILCMDGSEVTLVCTGGILANAVSASRLLKEQGISARVVSVPTLKPLDEKTLLKAVGNPLLVVVIEEHVLTGGLRSAILEAFSSANCQPPRLISLGIHDASTSIVGGQEYLRDFFNISPRGIFKTTLQALDTVKHLPTR